MTGTSSARDSATDSPSYRPAARCDLWFDMLERPGLESKLLVNVAPGPRPLARLDASSPSLLEAT